MSSSLSTPAPSRRLGERIREWVPAVVVFALGLAAWQWLLPDVLGVEDFLLPRFSDVVGALVDEHHLLLRGAWITLKEAVGGFVLGSGAAIVVALVLARWRPFGDALMPYMIAANAIPIIAFAPITNAWFGLLSPWSKVTIAAVLCFFPVLVNTLRGLTSVDPESIELMRSYAASERDVFRRVRIPSSLPYVFSALKVASVLAMIGAVVGDYFGGSLEALGHRRPERSQPLAVLDFVGGDSRGEHHGHCLLRDDRRDRAVRLELASLRDSEGIVGRYDRPGVPPRPRNGGHVKRRKWYLVGLVGAAVLAVAALTTTGLAVAGSSSPKLTKVTIQLKWVTQSQFAGYYAAKAKGYYKAAGLDVNLKVGGPTIVNEQTVLSKQAEFGVNWFPSLLANRDQGNDLVNIGAGLHAVRHDRGDLEEGRDQELQADAGEEVRRVDLRERVRAARGARQERHGS